MLLLLPYLPSAGVLLAVFLVDRVGRLPLLKVSSATAVVVLAVLVTIAGVFAAKEGVKDVNDVIVLPAKWPLYQLATLAVLAVSVVHSTRVSRWPGLVGSLWWAALRCSVFRAKQEQLVLDYWGVGQLGASITVAGRRVHGKEPAV